MATTAKPRKYKKVSCHTSKTAATGAAKKMRASGTTASVRKTTGGFCVYSAGKRKTGSIKRTGQRISGVRKRK